MDIEIFVTFEDNQVVSIALVIAEEEVLAVGRVNVLPVFHRKLYCRERGMGVDFILYSGIFEELQNSGYGFVVLHF